MKITYLIEIEPNTETGDRDYIEEVNAGIIHNFLVERFKSSKIGIVHRMGR